MYPPPPKICKNEMLVFGLHSTSDDQLSTLSNESHPNCEKNDCQIVKK